MSDQIIDQPRISLKSLNIRVERLGRTVEELDILVYKYQRLSAVYKELYETLDHIDVVAFKVRQEFDQMREVFRILLTIS